MPKSKGLTSFSYIKIDDQIYVLAKKLGEGAFGRVKTSEASSPSSTSETESSVESNDISEDQEVMNKSGEELVVKVIKSQARPENYQDEVNILNKELKALDKLGELRAHTFREAHDDKPRKYYIVAKKHSGEPLLNLLEDNRLSYQQKLYVAYLCCEKLKKAHDKGLLHLDVKPENIIVQIQLDDDGNLKIVDLNLIDWGASEVIKPNQDSMEIANTKGTPGYIAPEVTIKQAGKSSDIFSLGRMFAEDLFQGMDSEWFSDLYKFDSNERVSLPKMMDRIIRISNENFPPNKREDEIYQLIKQHPESQRPLLEPREPKPDPISMIIKTLNDKGLERMNAFYDESEDPITFYNKLSGMYKLLQDVLSINNTQLRENVKLERIQSLIKAYNDKVKSPWKIRESSPDKISIKRIDTIHELLHIKDFLKQAFDPNSELASWIKSYDKKDQIEQFSSALFKLLNDVERASRGRKSQGPEQHDEFINLISRLGTLEETMTNDLATVTRYNLMFERYSEVLDLFHQNMKMLEEASAAFTASKPEKAKAKTEAKAKEESAPSHLQRKKSVTFSTPTSVENKGAPQSLLDYIRVLRKAASTKIYPTKTHYQDEINQLLPLVNRPNELSKIKFQTIIDKHVNELDNFMASVVKNKHFDVPADVKETANKIIKKIDNIQKSFLSELSRSSANPSALEAIINEKSKFYQLCDERKKQFIDIALNVDTKSVKSLKR